MKKTLMIVVIHDNSEGRVHATLACDRLVERFWSECEFKISWWPSTVLSQPHSATEAMAMAITADVILFAFQPATGLSKAVKEWIETWLSQRGEREGTLVDLVTRGDEAHETAANRHFYLRQAAHRSGMDYLTREPQNLTWSFPDSLDAFAARADKVTTVLDQILHTETVPAAP